MFVQSPIDKYASILEDTNTLIGLPPYLAGQRSSTSPQGGLLSAATFGPRFFFACRDVAMAGFVLPCAVSGATRLV
jgi:hypothetical protein